jgi:hypothetical protein
MALIISGAMWVTWTLPGRWISGFCARDRMKAVIGLIAEVTAHLLAMAYKLVQKY